MSTIKVNAVRNTATNDGGIDIDASGHVQIDGQQLPTTGALSNRRLNENGAMQISQRGTSHSFAHDGTATGYTLDRMSFVTANLESFDGTVTQSTDAPAGFSNSWKLTTGTAEAAIDANDIAYVQTALEAQNLQLLQYGTSSAQTFTLSFYVKSSVTGTYGCTFYAPDGPRSRTATYTINTADTWELKTITLTGDTSGTINNDNGSGLQVAWNFATGSDWDATDSTSWGAHVNARWGYGHAQDGVITTASATWQITGIQLEVGEAATSFEHRSTSDELARCQRYYQRTRVIFYGNTPAVNSSATCNCPMFAEMRSDPTANLITAHSTTNVSTAFPPTTVGVLKNGWLVRVVASSTDPVFYSATWELTAEF